MAVILGLPTASAVTRPALLADANPGSDEVQLTEELMSPLAGVAERARGRELEG